MNKREAERVTIQRDTLRSLGFTRDEADALRRISMTLHRWHELECGTEHGYIQRENDDGTGRPFWYHESIGKRGRFPIADREAGAKKRLAAILSRVNESRYVGDTASIHAPNCDDLQAFIQTDPRGAALYILRPGDVPEGQDADAYYTNGIAVYK